MSSTPRRFARPDHQLAGTLDYFGGWFDHLADRLRAVSPGFDPDTTQLLLGRLAALDVGYTYGHVPTGFSYRDATHEQAAVAVLDEIHDHLVAGFAAGRAALADDPSYRPFWLLCGVANPYPYTDVGAAAGAAEPVHFIDLHDRADLEGDELAALEYLAQVVVLDLSAVELSDWWLSKIPFDALPDLRSLDLSENPITTVPAALAECELEWLSLRKTRVPAEVVATLRRARPRLHVAT